MTLWQQWAACGALAFAGFFSALVAGADLSDTRRLNLHVVFFGSFAVLFLALAIVVRP